jgi:hypothetical protein
VSYNIKDGVPNLKVWDPARRALIVAVVNLKGLGKATTDQYFASATGLSSVLTRHEKCFGSRPAYFDDDKKAWVEAYSAKVSDS